jgi:hypothetical protein
MKVVKSDRASFDSILDSGGRGTILAEEWIREVFRDRKLKCLAGARLGRTKAALA